MADDSPHKILSPNQTPFPSYEGNNPELQPFLAKPSQRQITFDEVPAETALGNLVGDFAATPQGPASHLIALRMLFPHLEVIPWPSRVVSLALVANVATELYLPDGTVAIIMRGNNDYYVSNHGNADVPTAVLINQTTSQSMYKPEGYILYTGNLRSLSLIAPNAGTIVSAMCFPLTLLNP